MIVLAFGADTGPPGAAIGAGGRIAAAGSAIIVFIIPISPPPATLGVLGSSKPQPRQNL